MAFCVQQQISTFAHVIGPFETYADTLLGENAAPLNRTIPNGTAGGCLTATERSNAPLLFPAVFYSVRFLVKLSSFSGGILSYT